MRNDGCIEVLCKSIQETLTQAFLNLYPVYSQVFRYRIVLAGDGGDMCCGSKKSRLRKAPNMFEPSQCYHISGFVPVFIVTSKFENPHATITVKDADKVWTVTLAPTFRMLNRGATADMVAAGKTVSAFGYPSTVERDEMRAERITVDGKTIEMR